MIYKNLYSDVRPPPCKKKIAPCQEACPAGMDVPAYIRCIQKGRFGEALAIIREKIPFPFVCGYACVHPCEAKCSRKQFEGPVAIRMLKWAAAEYDQERFCEKRSVKTSPSGKTVAVVGAGPAGLTAAYFLAQLGHKVTVYEALPVAGGMMRFGIPEYRLPQAVVEGEIREIEKAGVQISTNSRVESLDDLLAEKGYHAVVLALGAQKGIRLPIPGSHEEGVWVGIDFLKEARLGKRVKLGDRVVVLGGGNVALDCARTARRLGAKEMIVAFPEPRLEMPAAPEEIEQAEEEDIQLHPSLAFAGITVKGGKIEGVECLDVVSLSVDEDGGVHIETAPGTERLLPADTVIFAVGQRPLIPEGFKLGEKGNRIPADPSTCRTIREGVFAVGDAAGGTASLIHAMASGRKGASVVDRYLGGNGLIEHPAADEGASEPQEPAPRWTCRSKPREASPRTRVESFEVVERGYDRATAIREAGRCLSCDLREFQVKVDEQVCKACSYCREVCGLEVFDRSENYNMGGYRPFVPIRPERCIGCLKCLYICPDFAITIEDSSEQ